MIERVIRKLRSFYYSKVFNAKGLVVDTYLPFKGDGEVSIGKGVVINKGVIIQCPQGCKVIIGDNVTLSYNVLILSSGRRFNYRGVTKDHINSTIKIGPGTWIGAGSIILPGVIVPPNCVIGAGSILSKSLEFSNSVYVGSPANKVRSL